MDQCLARCQVRLMARCRLRAMHLASQPGLTPFLDGVRKLLGHGNCCTVPHLPGQLMTAADQNVATWQSSQCRAPAVFLLFKRRSRSLRTVTRHVLSTAPRRCPATGCHKAQAYRWMLFSAPLARATTCDDAQHAGDYHRNRIAQRHHCLKSNTCPPCLLHCWVHAPTIYPVPLSCSAGVQACSSMSLDHALCCKHSVLRRAFRT
jgi:hypothetical protein